MYGCFFGSEDHWEEVDARRHALWWLWRPILDLQALEQDGHVNVVSVTGWLTESWDRVTNRQWYVKPFKSIKICRDDHVNNKGRFITSFPHQDTGATYPRPPVRRPLRSPSAHRGSPSDSRQPLRQGSQGLRANHQPEENRSPVSEASTRSLHPTLHHHWRLSAQCSRTLYLPGKCHRQRRNNNQRRW